MNGITANQRADQVLDDPYGNKDAYVWLNRAAFAQPAFGTLGDSLQGGYRGPSSWSIDMVLARTIDLAMFQRVELRAEAFNVLNTVRLNNPVTNLSSATFGRILGSAPPRIIQLGLKFEF
jgi:hypothetical protein